MVSGLQTTTCTGCWGMAASQGVGWAGEMSPGRKGLELYQRHALWLEIRLRSKTTHQMGRVTRGLVRVHGVCPAGEDTGDSWATSICQNLRCHPHRHRVSSRTVHGRVQLSQSGVVITGRRRGFASSCPPRLWKSQVPGRARLQQGEVDL